MFVHRVEGEPGFEVRRDRPAQRSLLPPGDLDARFLLDAQLLLGLLAADVYAVEYFYREDQDADS